MKDTALVIMAAGIGSRFGGGIKQLEPVGPGGEIIMDYSIHDALEAGFNKIVFIIRHDLEQDFKEIIGRRIEKIAEVEYAFQELDDLPEGYEKPENRTKPWGTGQAILCAKEVIRDPFVVINADDYYGKEAFVKIHDYLVNQIVPDSNVFDICMAGFILGNTLSENGGVTRGVCRVDENEILLEVAETYELKQQGDLAEGRDEEGKIVRVPLKQNVSMNMWGMSPVFLEELERGFPEFLDSLAEGDIKTEYLLPRIIGKLVQEGRAKVRVLETADKWFGVTYKEDKPAVAKAIRGLVNQGLYPERLFG